MKFQDEMGGVFILEFCGLRSKMYSILKDDEQEKKAANGVPGQVKNDLISHFDYREVLLDKLLRFHTATRIIQKNHELYTADVTKKTLSPYNDKNWITFEDGEYISYSYGHYKIEEYEQCDLLE